MQHLMRVPLCLMLLTYISRALSSSSAEYLNPDELAQLTDLLQDFQLNDKQAMIKQQPLDANQLLNQPSEYITGETGTVSNEDNVENSNEIGGIETGIKSKRGWEEIQRPWRGYFPKRAWDVVRSYWRLPAFRIAYRNYIGKRSNEELVEVPVQPGNEQVPTMINELGYNVDGDPKSVPDPENEINNVGNQDYGGSWNNKKRYEKRGDWEATSEFPNDRILKGRLEDIQLLPIYSPLKRGWGDLIPFPDRQFGKRGWEDVRLSSYRNVGKRGWEDVRLFQKGQFGKRGWEDVRFNTYRPYGKRGWEDIRLFQSGQFGKRGWEDLRLFRNGQFGKRGWEDVRLFQGRHTGKRDVDAIQSYYVGENRQNEKRGWEDIRLPQNGQFGKRSGVNEHFYGDRGAKRGWEDVRPYDFNRLGKRGWEDIRLFHGCGCCNSAHSYRYCCFSCRSRFRKRSIENGHSSSDRSHVVQFLN